MPSPWQPPSFSTESWYLDPADSRCPHDGEVDSLEIAKSAAETSSGVGHDAVTLTLLGAHRIGWLVFTYSGVRSHSLASYCCDQGAGNWLRDEFTASSAGLTCHRITWHCPDSGTSQWLIEAAEIRYEWKPKSG